VLPGRLPLAFALSIVPILSQAAPAPPSSSGLVGARIPAQVPLQFEANRGQTDRRAKFISHGRDYTLFLTPTEAVMTLVHHTAQPAFLQRHAYRAALLPASSRASILRMRLLGADPAAPITGKGLLPGRVNIYQGRHPGSWQTNVPAYAQVQYKGVYPGINLVYYGNQSRLEYDFVVAPKASPAAIRLGFAGVRSLQVDKQGNLVVGLPDGQVRWHKPVVYQQKNGKRIQVAGRYALLGPRQVGFHIARYDRTRPLVIDPVLVYSTYLGGSDRENGAGIGVDAAGNFYVGGDTSATDFPVQNAIQTTNHGGIDLFVSKFSPAGKLLYSTYLGGSSDDRSYTLTADPAGNVYLSGCTTSTDFPVKNAYQPTYHGGLAAFVIKLDKNGSLVFSTYLSGTTGIPGISPQGNTPWDEANAVTYDSQGDVFVTGETYDADFPVTTNALQKTHAYCYVSKFGPSGRLLYSTYLGGTGGAVADYGRGIAVDANDNMYVTGAAGSHDFPTVNAFQPTFGGGTYDAFLSKISADGSHLIYSTYIGGSGDEADKDYPYIFHAGLAVDANGNAYVSGVTDSTDFPVKNAFQPRLAGGWDAWVAKFDPNGQPLFSTYLGGSGDEYIHDNTGRTTTGLALDGRDNIYLIGATNSLDFPTKDAFQPAFGGGNWDAYVTKLDTNGALVYSTYLGGSGDDVPRTGAIAADAASNVYVAGNTTSADFPIVNAFQKTYNGNTDAFIVKIAPAAFVASDFNGDGHPDIVFQNPSSGQLAVWYLNGTTAIGGDYITPVQDPHWKTVGVADFNADSHPDLLFQNPQTGQLALWLMDGATATGGLLLSSTVPAGWSVVSVNDFNGDRYPDLLLQNASTGGLIARLMSGTTVIEDVTLNDSLSSGWSVVGSGDFNGDGKQDLVLQNSSSGRLAVWFMNGATVTDGAYLTPAQSANWKCVAVLDLNADGKPDLVFQNSATGQLAYWIMNGTKAVDGNFFSTTPPSGWLVAGPH